MASKTSAKSHLFLSLNLLFYVLSATANGNCGGGGPSATPPGGGGGGPSTSPSSGGGGSGGPSTSPSGGGGGGPSTSPSGGEGGGGGGGGGPSTSPPGGGRGGGGPSTSPSRGGGGGGGPSTSPSRGGGGGGGGGRGGGGGGGSVTPPGGGGGGGGSNTARCPRDALKLGVCANLLGGLVGVVVGSPPTTPCCTLLAGLADLEAAVCLCTAIRANVVGINLNVPLSLSLLLNACARTPPTGFTC